MNSRHRFRKSESGGFELFLVSIVLDKYFRTNCKGFNESIENLSIYLKIPKYEGKKVLNVFRRTEGFTVYMAPTTHMSPYGKAI